MRTIPPILVFLGAVVCTPLLHAAQPRVSVHERIVEGTIGDLQQRIRAGEMGCEDVVRAYLERIRVYDRASGLNAVTYVAADAIEQARAADERVRRGDQPGPLFCVTVAVKDNIDTADMPTTGGSRVLRESTPPDDAALVRALRAAGAIMLAKTNMAEWAFSPRRTISSSAGATANAYALDRVPAGSSGGTASAVAAMDRARVTALIYPSWAFPPALSSRAVENYRGDNSQTVAPATGLPALTVPMGFNEDDLPAGLQMLGRPWAEGALYSLAYGYERKTRHRAPPKLFPPLRNSAP